MNSAAQQIQNVLNHLVADGRERGLQVVAYLNGRLVLDVCAGVADHRNNVPVDGNTLFAPFSVVKGFVATAVHRLVDRGTLAYDDPVMKYWPEFGAHGKDQVTLRHVLQHTAGVPYLPRELSPVDAYNWDTICGTIAVQKPVHAPGATVIYHALTYGWILGEIVRRASGQRIEKIIADEICQPLDIQDFYIGLPDALSSRVALIEDKTGDAAPLPTNQSPQTLPIWIHPLGEWMNQPEARRASVPGGNGIMNARTIARHYASLLPGGVDGVELLSPARIREITPLNIPPGTRETDLPNRIGGGYHLGGKDSYMGSRPSIFGHPGYGGSVGFADPEHNFAYGFTKNRFSSRGAEAVVAAEVRRVLQIPA